ncbi:MAG: hypothetical protein R3D00_23870 [Bacteroidia bacterium]
MDQIQINRLIADKAFSDTAKNPELIETHISWVILTDHYAYKIKKPVQYSFLDFSTLKNRAYFTRRELLLNSRLSEGVYLKRVPIWELSGSYSMEDNGGEIVDWAVMMRRMSKEKQMNHMLREGKVTHQHIDELAEKLATFHKDTKVNFVPQSLYNLKLDFNDILSYRETALSISLEAAKTIDRAINTSNRFLLEHQRDFRVRVDKGYVRDCHGDLHTGNIFLESPPVIFDCIEFNDAWRQTDILDEVGFLCMDLEASGADDLSAYFLQAYLNHVHAFGSPQDEALLIYYKLYRANVRMKVLLLEFAKNKLQEDSLNAIQNMIGTYVAIINRYISQLSTPSTIRAQAS